MKDTDANDSLVFVVFVVVSVRCRTVKQCLLMGNKEVMPVG